ncbi:unnamed protein product [marine sediment metagenome]|uniref:Uncharacterized protein n=1 Tax=marine sediment metagenome TaxID=412755 RepID=X0VSF7_9ZZZZ
MKEGVVKEIKEYFKYGEDGLEEIPITKKEYDRILMTQPIPPPDPFYTCPVGYHVYREIRLSLDTIYGITGVLSYDKGLNLFATKHGYHPASGYKLCETHKRIVKQRDEQIDLFGEDARDTYDGLAKPRCEKCRQ